MEALGAASSIAGLLSLAGQCVSGLQKLHALYQDIAAASNTVDTFLKEVNSLLRGLHDVEALLHKIDTQAGTLVDDVSSVSLKILLEDCNTSISTWVGTACSFQPSGAKGGKAWFLRFWVAVNKDSVSSIRTEMQRRRTEITLSLATLGRLLDVHLALKTDSINSKATESVDLNRTLANQSGSMQDTLDRIEALSESVAAMSVGSMRSLASLTSAMSHGSSQHSAPVFSARYGSPTASPTASRADSPGLYTSRSRSPSLASLPEQPEMPPPIRKRVTRACDRCRLKKSKCDGGNPCSRCQNDKAICIFGERKKSTDQTYPKSYVDLLERQQEKLTSALQQLYERLDSGQPWTGPLLSRSNGCPSAHDIVAALQDDVHGMSGKAQEAQDGEHRISRTDSQAGHTSHGANELQRSKNNFDALATSERNSVLSNWESTSFIDWTRARSNRADGLAEWSREPRLATNGIDATNTACSNTLIASSWDASLLADWTSQSDRINRWILHTLGSDPKQIGAHRQILAGELQAADIADQDFSERAWSRSVLKYWFLDEAATGVNFAAGSEPGESLRMPSLFSLRMPSELGSTDGKGPLMPGPNGELSSVVCPGLSTAPQEWEWLTVSL